MRITPEHILRATVQSQSALLHAAAALPDSTPWPEVKAILIERLRELDEIVETAMARAKDTAKGDEP